MNIAQDTLKRALNDAYLAGFNDSGEGYNGEYPFDNVVFAPLDDAGWVRRRDRHVGEAAAKITATSSQENSAEVIYLLDQLSAALDTMLTHFANQTLPADMASRTTLLNQADKLLRLMGER